jgi:hypothetical protein
VCYRRRGYRIGRGGPGPPPALAEKPVQGRSREGRRGPACRSRTPGPPPPAHAGTCRCRSLGHAGKHRRDVWVAAATMDRLTGLRPTPAVRRRHRVRSCRAPVRSHVGRRHDRPRGPVDPGRAHVLGGTETRGGRPAPPSRCRADRGRGRSAPTCLLCMGLPPPARTSGRSCRLAWLRAGNFGPVRGHLHMQVSVVPHPGHPRVPRGGRPGWRTSRPAAAAGAVR